MDATLGEIAEQNWFENAEPDVMIWPCACGRDTGSLLEAECAACRGAHHERYLIDV
jgi:hypothetical protein